MRKTILFLFLLTTQLLCAQIRLLSWNLENFGKSKSDSTIIYLAGILKDYDIVAIQEIVAGDGGAQAVAKLSAELNRKGSQWNYVVSDPTSSSAYKTERYAFLWKTAKIKRKGKAWLERKYHLQIDREPFYATFEYGQKQFTLANFHAITKSRQPETEIKYFKFLPQEYPDLNLVFVGDFNCPQSHTVFNPLKEKGYRPAFMKQKTSLRQECRQNDCLASEFDNIWFQPALIKVADAQAIHFYKSFPSLKKARQISDHIPVTVQFILKK